MAYDKHKIGESVKLQRLAKGYTQSYLSQISGVGVRSIQRIENGEVNARLYTLNILQEKLNFKFDETHLKAKNPDLKKGNLSRRMKIILSYAFGFLFVIVMSIFLIKSITFPETQFELFIFISSGIAFYSMILFYIWRK